jgi:predicted transcriptional regulator
MPLDPSKIRERRIKLNRTQADCAARADMPQPHWARIESGGRVDPQLSTAERIAQALDCNLKMILA